MKTLIRNCKLKYRCSMKWDLLEKTSDEDVRYCPECKKSVHHCQTDDQLIIAIIDDHCVAVSVTGDSVKFLRLDDDSDWDNIP